MQCCGWCFVSESSVRVISCGHHARVFGGLEAKAMVEIWNYITEGEGMYCHIVLIFRYRYEIFCTMIYQYLILHQKHEILHVHHYSVQNMRLKTHTPYYILSAVWIWVLKPIICTIFSGGIPLVLYRYLSNFLSSKFLLYQ